MVQIYCEMRDLTDLEEEALRWVDRQNPAGKDVPERYTEAFRGLWAMDLIAVLDDPTFTLDVVSLYEDVQWGASALGYAYLQQSVDTVPCPEEEEEGPQFPRNYTTEDCPLGWTEPLSYRADKAPCAEQDHFVSVLIPEGFRLVIEPIGV